MKKQGRNWLLMGGELSGYTFDLFDTIASHGNIDIRFLYNPLDGISSFQHENTEGRALNRLCWKDAGLAQILKFVGAPRPDAVFVYGNRPRLKMRLALLCLPSASAVFYAADTNIVELAQSPVRTIGRRLACTAIAKRATAALSLGFTNRLALQALGFHHTVDLPAYAVDFAALGAATKAAGVGTSDRFDDEVVVLIVARLTPVKNLPNFVRTFVAQSDLTKRMRLVIVGEGPEREALQEIQRHTPSLRMELLGAVPRRDIGTIFRRADVLVLPSLVEPWGIVVVEALGMGLPVIATPAVGAAVSLAGHAGAVLLSKDTDPKSVLACLRRYMDERPTLVAVAREGMPHIRQHFDRVEVAKATIRLVYGDCPSPTVSGPC